MFEVEYFWNVWVNKDEVNVSLIQYYCPNFRYPIDFTCSYHLSLDFGRYNDKPFHA